MPLEADYETVYGAPFLDHVEIYLLRLTKFYIVCIVSRHTDTVWGVLVYNLSIPHDMPIGGLLPQYIIY